MYVYRLVSIRFHHLQNLRIDNIIFTKTELLDFTLVTLGDLDIGH